MAIILEPGELNVLVLLHHLRLPVELQLLVYSRGLDGGLYDSVCKCNSANLYPSLQFLPGLDACLGLLLQVIDLLGTGFCFLLSSSTSSFTAFVFFVWAVSLTSTPSCSFVCSSLMDSTLFFLFLGDLVRLGNNLFLILFYLIEGLAGALFGVLHPQTLLAV